MSTGGTNGLPSNYEAVAVSAGKSTLLTLTSDGYLYGAGGSSYLGGVDTTGTGKQSTFTRLDGIAGSGSNILPAHTTANPIVDFSTGVTESYVLYQNGDLYMLKSTTATLLASNITMFDSEPRSYYMYAVTSSNTIQIYYNGSQVGSDITPTGTVTQVRGGGSGGWGYLNSDGDLYLAASPGGTPSILSTTDKFVYFDMEGEGSATYGALTTTGVTKFWGANTYGELGTGSTGALTYSSPSIPTAGGGVDHTYFGESGLGQNTPPAFDFSAYLSRFSF